MSGPAEARVALVTGGNRGIGLEICRQLARKGLRVVLASRDTADGEKAAAALRVEKLDVTGCQLDITDPGSVAQCRAWVEQRFRRLDALVNNAAISIDPPERPNVLDADPEVVRRTFDTNVLGALRLCQAFIPRMKAQGYGRVVNVSSTLGQFDAMGPGYAGYRLSKTALNALTAILAKATAGTNVLVNAVCPGWVKTRMGGAEAPLSVEEGADTPVWAATLPDGGPTGGFFRRRERIPW